MVKSSIVVLYRNCSLLETNLKTSLSKMLNNAIMKVHTQKDVTINYLEIYL